MPIERCTLDGRPGFRWSKNGKCYAYSPNSPGDRKRARMKAARQGAAARAAGFAEAVEVQEAALLRTTSRGGSVTGTQQQFRQGWLDALDRFNTEVDLISGGIDPATRRSFPSPADELLARNRAAARLSEDWGDIVEESVRAAHATGMQAWGGKILRPEEAQAQVDAFVAKQRRFASRFALDVSQGYPQLPGKMPIGARTTLYEKSLDGAFNLGTLSNSPDGVIITWMLGAADHCFECPVISLNSPYTRESLPTWPGAGVTPCRSRCACWLEYVPSRDVKLQGDPGNVIDRTLNPSAPPGTRLPTPEERARILDVEGRMNHARRRVSTSTGAEKQAAIRERKNLNAELIRLTQGAGIHHVPTFSAGEIVTGVDIRPGDVSALTHLRGIDGTTIAKTQAHAVQVALQESLTDLDKLLKMLPAGVGEEVEAGALPGTAAGATVHLQAPGGRAALLLHLEAVRILRHFPNLEVGPLDLDWPWLVLTLGTWVSGPAKEVEAFQAQLGQTFLAVPYQDRG